MGFEVTYKYHEKTDGEYNREETKVFKKKVGDPFDDVSLEKLAAAIMAQLARRDVWILDVEVFELSKKVVNFKEAKGGIILKNKKFLFDGGGEDASNIIVQDMVQSNQPVHSVVQSQSLTPNQTAISTPVPVPSPQQTVTIQGAGASHEQIRPRRPIDVVIFAPEPQQMVEIKNYKLTIDKKYNVYEKKEVPLGQIFSIQDDSGKDILVSDRYFIPGRIHLVASELGFDESQQKKDGGNLYWGNANLDPNMPDIRRR